MEHYAPTRSFGGFWLRVAAIMVDGLIISIPTWFVRSIDQVWLSVIMTWLYFALFESSKLRATPGKLLLGLAVTDLAGEQISFIKATTRFFAKWLSTLLLFAGHILAAFTPRKQALHDLLAQTLVIRR